VVTARRDPAGMITLPASAYITIPAALRRRCGMEAGDQVLLAALPDQRPPTDRTKTGSPVRYTPDRCYRRQRARDSSAMPPSRWWTIPVRCRSPRSERIAWPIIGTPRPAQIGGTVRLAGSVLEAAALGVSLGARVSLPVR